jgi:hypothetical protein
MQEQIDPNNADLQDEIETEQDVTSMIGRLRNAYENLTPERQTVIGVFATYTYLTMLFFPEKLPDFLQPMLEELDKIPMTRISLWTTTMIAMIGSADGVRRIISERLPFYKAYVQVFMLGRFADDDVDEDESRVI